MMNDNQPPPVMLIVGRAYQSRDSQPQGVHVLLMAPDDDTAVRTALEALSREGYVKVELDRIGEMQGPPDEEPHASAYQGALEGEVSIVTTGVVG